MSPDQELAEMERSLLVLKDQNERLRSKVERLEDAQKRFFDAGWHAGRNTKKNAAASWLMYLESIGRA